ncbi:phosphodiester glycosidase family protein, partial [Patescibacteria group bacterium]|nr:phosphodiester glycosidase family protein [Patescibacteria group bacterium]
MDFKTLKNLSLPRGKLLLFLGLAISVLMLVGAIYWVYQQHQQISQTTQQVNQLSSEKTQLNDQLNQTQATLTALQNEDQVKKNRDLQEEINNIQTTYKQTVSAYEDMLSLSDKKVDTSKMSESFALILNQLSQRNYTDAQKTLADLNNQIKTTTDKLNAETITPIPNVPTSNTAPSGGYSRQTVQTDSGSFLVDIVAADLNSTRVIVDTASDGDCGNNCPVLSLADYVSRNGAFAGVNGSYFCPASYPSCAGKTNTFDTLLMNKNKRYFNSDNNVYSTVPAVIFQGTTVRFVSQSLEWGRDTGVDAVLANYPLLILGNNIVYGGSSDAKLTSKGNRSFVGNKGSTVYIGVVHLATVMDSAKVMKALGIENALNLDDGGSTALWSGGYKVGPGRDLPNVLLFI